MQEPKEKTLHRLKIAKGHLGKVIKMVEQDEYCIDVVHQSIAVQAALKEVDSLVLDNHLRMCVSDSIKKGEGNKVIDEVIKVLRKKQKGGD
ncbi:metal-sensitive transcriptional regulator [Patescibacteria group bacterium]